MASQSSKPPSSSIPHPRGIEINILQGILREQPHAVIARELGLFKADFDARLGAIRHKLQVDHNKQIVGAAAYHGWLDECWTADQYLAAHSVRLEPFQTSLLEASARGQSAEEFCESYPADLRDYREAARQLARQLGHPATSVMGLMVVIGRIDYAAEGGPTFRPEPKTEATPESEPEPVKPSPQMYARPSPVPSGAEQDHDSFLLREVDELALGGYGDAGVGTEAGREGV